MPLNCFLDVFCMDDFLKHSHPTRPLWVLGVNGLTILAASTAPDTGYQHQPGLPDLSHLECALLNTSRQLWTHHKSALTLSHLEQPKSLVYSGDIFLLKVSNEKSLMVTCKSTSIRQLFFEVYVIFCFIQMLFSTDLLRAYLNIFLNEEYK